MTEDIGVIEAENVSLKHVNDQLRFEVESQKSICRQLMVELETQKSISRHFEGIANIVMAEMEKAKWVLAKDKGERLSALLVQFNNEMKGFVSEKHQLMSRFLRIEHLAHSISAILKQL